MIKIYQIYFLLSFLSTVVGTAAAAAVVRSAQQNTLLEFITNSDKNRCVFIYIATLQLTILTITFIDIRNSRE